MTRAPARAAALAAALAVVSHAGPFSDYRTQRPGVRHRITPADLPAPDPESDVLNGARVIPRPEGAWPKAPPGFEVRLYAEGLEGPRLIRAALNGDIFVAESYAGRIKVFRGIDEEGRPKQVSIFAEGLDKPFGMAFWLPGPEPQYLYVAETGAVVRFPYRMGDLRARGEREKVLDLPGGGLLRGGGHWTRDVVFSNDGKTMYVAVGSKSNNDDVDGNPQEKNRACVLAADADGKNARVFASGLRNPVSLAIRPGSEELWASVNERDGLGDDLPPDYVTRVRPGGFYGWPWYYIGGNPDPRHAGKHPELKAKTIVPDVLLQPHNASLGMAFYDHRQFPAEYRGDLFAAQHGSWNRAKRTGYEIVRIPFEKGKASGDYEDFVTGFVTEDGKVWGRPVGVATAVDGSLIFSDDGGGRLWRVVRARAAK